MAKRVIVVDTLTLQKGDIVVADSPTSVVQLPAGVDGQALVADSTAASGLKYAAVSTDAKEIMLTSQIFS